MKNAVVSSLLLLCGVARADLPVAISPGDELPARFAIDDKYLYWLSGSGVWRVAKTGEDLTKVDGGGGFDLALGGDSLYRSGPQKVDRMKRGGGGLSSIVRTPPGDTRIAADDGGVYWTMKGQIIRTSKGGGGSKTVARPPVDPTEMLVDGGTLYYVMGGVIWAVPKNGGKERQFAAGESLLSSGDFLFYVTKNRTQIAKRERANGETVEMLQRPDGLQIGALASDGENLYWLASKGPLIRLLSISLAGGGVPQVLGEGLFSSTKFLAADAESLYFLGREDGKQPIMKLAK